MLLSYLKRSQIPQFKQFQGKWSRVVLKYVLKPRMGISFKAMLKRITIQ